MSESQPAPEEARKRQQEELYRRYFKQSRARMGMTTKELAELIDKHHTTVRKYEDGQRPVPKVVILAIEGMILHREKGVVSRFEGFE